ncbi:phosphopantetheine-binding protein, partial [Frankia sp. AiPs1]|uniref:type I polyketide synthase n=1 Tax=Frankia sp. AiPs1 TaxID=573493 RepID=UPI002043E101
ARGVRPAAVLGQGVGVFAAAHVAGALSLSDATALLSGPGPQPGEGACYAVAGAEAAVAEALAPTEQAGVVVAVYGPRSTVIAVDPARGDAAFEALRARDLRCVPFTDPLVAHGPFAGGPAEHLESTLAALMPRPPTLRLPSTLVPGTDSTLLDGAHWSRMFRGPELLWPALVALSAEEDRPLVEIGPRPGLLSTLARARRDAGLRAPALTILDDDAPVGGIAPRTLARLHAAGVRVDWSAVTGRPHRYRTLPVPTWGGGRYWLPGVERGAQGTAAPAAAVPPPTRIRLSLLDEHGQVTTEMYAERTAPVLPVPTTATSQPASAPRSATPSADAVGPVAVATGAAPASAPAPADIGRLAELVSGLVRELLGLPADHPIGRRRGLFEQGLDSVTAIALRTRLEERLGVDLPTTVVFEQPTINGLAGRLAELVAASAPRQIFREAPDPVPRRTQNLGQVPAQVQRVATSGPQPPAGARTEPLAADPGIAVIGMSCRLPGAATPTDFWELLCGRRETAGELPAARRRDPVWARLAGQAARRGSYLDDIAAFDAPFFRISPREARLLDPQQRLFLEAAWEALEHAGCPADTLDGRPVGVYAGLSMADYQFLVADDLDGESLTLHHGTGTSFSVLAGRLSYILGLRGPSMTVDTACSSALTAVHLACQALRAGDCETAVVGGASAIVAPSPLLASLVGGHALAADGRCRSFDENADGFACGEGAVVFVLKPLAAAERDGDEVHAVLRASAVNQDGATGGLTVPSPAAQVDVVRTAVRRAGWAPGDVDYVEAHGTGTVVGDRTELSAL